MISRLVGALVRAIMIILLVATPGLLIPGVPTESTQFAAFIAIFVGVLVFVEYTSHTPIMIEFRDAPPFNRIRFLSFFLIIFLLTALMRGAVLTTPLAGFVYTIGDALGRLLDFPYSPVRLTLLMLPPEASTSAALTMRAMAGISYVLSILTIIGFIISIRIFSWPGRGSTFNVLTNLPMFDPTSGGDVVDRLARGARLNIAMGFLLPFIIPALVKVAGPLIDPAQFENAQTMVWLVALWAFLPASLYMRGVAMGRLVQMIENKRRRRYAQALENGDGYASA